VKELVNQIKVAPFEPTSVLRTMSEIAERVDASKGEESKKNAQFRNSHITAAAPAGTGLDASKDKEVSRLVAEIHGRDEIERTRTRLNAMLDCQASFSGTISAPIVFFLGSFLVSIFGNLAQLGDNSNSHALAFGEWLVRLPSCIPSCASGFAFSDHNSSCSHRFWLSPCWEQPKHLPSNHVQHPGRSSQEVFRVIVEATYRGQRVPLVCS
jgi:hypothetical protein